MVAASKLRQVFTYESWVHAVAGAAGGCTAMLAFYPLDTVRSRIQLDESKEKNKKHQQTMKVIKQIILTEGFSALYQGLGPVLQSLCISNFIYFYAFHTLKALNHNNLKSHNIYKDLLLGAIAGIVNVLLTTPFWVVNTRLRMRYLKSNNLDKYYYNNLLSGIKYVAKTEGAKGLWSGTTASLVLVCNPALQFMMYELLKRKLSIQQQSTSEMIHNTSTSQSFVMGALAKAFATILTYPLQLIQTKQRHHTNKTSNKNNETETEYQSIMKMLWSIIHNHGIKGLYRGMEVKILQTVLTAALMFMIYEKINNGVRLLLLKNKQP